MVISVYVGAVLTTKHPILGRLRLEPFTSKLVQQCEHTQQADHDHEAEEDDLIGKHQLDGGIGAGGVLGGATVRQWNSASPHSRAPG